MTRAEFLTEFKAALERPEVIVLREGTGEPAALRFQVDGVRVDPIGLVWWMRTGTTHPLRLLEGLSYGRSLGLTTEDALDLLDASDGRLGLPGGRVRTWRAWLDRVVLGVTGIGP